VQRYKSDEGFAVIVKNSAMRNIEIRWPQVMRVKNGVVLCEGEKLLCRGERGKRI